MCEVGESVLQSTLDPGFSDVQSDKRDGMLPRAQRIVDGDEGIGSPSPGSRDEEPAVAMGVVPGDAGLLGVDNMLTVEQTGQRPGACRLECAIMARGALGGVLAGMAFSAGLAPEIQFRGPCLTGGLANGLERGLSSVGLLRIHQKSAKAAIKKTARTLPSCRHEDGDWPETRGVAGPGSAICTYEDSPRSPPSRRGRGCLAILGSIIPSCQVSPEVVDPYQDHGRRLGISPEVNALRIQRFLAEAFSRYNAPPSARMPSLSFPDITRCKIR